MKFLCMAASLALCVRAAAGCADLLTASHTYLPANSSRFLIGVLVEIPPFQVPVLAVTRYLGRHKDLLCGLRQMYNHFELRWAGELFVRNSRPEPGFAKIEVANETSGLVHGSDGKTIQLECGEKEPFNLRVAANDAKELSRMSPALFAPTFRTLTYSESTHLLKSLPGEGNFRHDLGNSIGWLTLVLRFKGTPLRYDSEGLLQLRESQRRHLENILLAVSVSDVSNAHAPEVRELSWKLRVMLTGTMPTDYENFRRLLGVFARVVDGTSDWSTL